MKAPRQSATSPWCRLAWSRAKITAENSIANHGLWRESRLRQIMPLHSSSSQTGARMDVDMNRSTGREVSNISSKAFLKRSDIGKRLVMGSTRAPMKGVATTASTNTGTMLLKPPLRGSSTGTYPLPRLKLRREARYAHRNGNSIDTAYTAALDLTPSRINAAANILPTANTRTSSRQWAQDGK